MNSILSTLRKRLIMQVVTLGTLLPGIAIFPCLSYANPAGGVVVAGHAHISGVGTAAVNINQQSNLAIIDWQSFSIAAGEITTFNQPGVNSVALNRVVSGNPSAIYGQLKANGGVILINPNGIVVGSSGVIDIGGLLGLSTLDMTNEDFMNGGANRYRGTSSAGVANYGALTSQSGDVVLLGNFLRNAGSVSAPGGTVAFGAGGDIIVDQAGGATISILSGGAGGGVGIENTGSITGAAAELKAHGNVYALAIQNDGLVRANGYKFKGGRLTLSAGTGSGRIINTGDLYARNSDGSGGAVRVSANEVEINSGRVDASGAAGKDGGSVVVTGDEVIIGASTEISVAGSTAGTVNLSGVNTLKMDGAVDASSSVGIGGSVDLQSAGTIEIGNTASIDVSGVVEGGQIRTGGGLQGRDGEVMNSSSTTVARGASFNADASMGDAGTVIIWSDGDTLFRGSISAQATGAVGNGGFIEISGKRKLFFDGNANTLAAGSGSNGILLFDPTDVFIGPTGATMTDRAVVAAVLQNNVVIHTSSGNAQNGNIWIEAGSNIQYDSPNSLSFFANGSIFVDGDIKNYGSTDGLVNVVGTKIIGTTNGGLTNVEVNIGTGNINLVAGWDGTGAGAFSGEFDPDTGVFTAPFGGTIWAADIIGGTYGDYGLNSGSVIINLSGAEPVEVGSARGETNVFGNIVRLQSGNGGAEFAQVGFRRENDIRATAVSGLGVDGLIDTADDILIRTFSINPLTPAQADSYANAAIPIDPTVDVGDVDYFTGVYGDINVYAKDEVQLTNFPGGNPIYVGRFTDRTYTMIGHGGRREQDNDMELRAGTDYGSDSGNITVGNGNNFGDITVYAGGKLTMEGDRAEAQVQIGHGGDGNDDPDGNRANTASDVGANLAQSVGILGDMGGDITITAASIEMKAGFMNSTFAIIGHGGKRVRGSFWGNITIETTVGGITAEAAPDVAVGGPDNDANSWILEQNRDQSFVQIGHGGFDSDSLYATPGRTVVLNTRAGSESVANTSNPGDGININPNTGIAYGNSGDISVISAAGIEFRAGNGTDAYAMIGHGGRSTSGDMVGNIKVEAKAGNIIFTRDADQVNRFGRDLTDLGQRAFVQIGHGGARFSGGATGDIDVDATGNIEFYGGRAESYAMIGHGGVAENGSTWNDGRQRGANMANGTLSGNINVDAGGNIKFRSGFGSGGQAFSQIGNGGYYMRADVWEPNSVGGIGSLVGGGAAADDQEGHNGDIVVNAGGDISFIAGPTDLLEGQTYIEMNRYDNYTMIGNGGNNSDGDSWGSITITAGGDLTLEARGGWDTVTIENNGGDNNTNTLGTPRLNSGEDNGRTGYRNFAQIGNGGYDVEHVNTNNTDNWNNTGKNGDGIGVDGNSDIIITIGGNLRALGAMKDTAGIPIPQRAILTNGVDNPINPPFSNNIYNDEEGNVVTIGAGYSQFYGRLRTITRADGEVWTLPDPVFMAESSYVQIGNGGALTDYRGSGGAATAGGTGTVGNAIDGEGFRGDITIDVGGDIRVEAGDIKQSVAVGQALTIQVLNYQGNPGGTGTIGGAGSYLVGPALGTDTANFINGDNSQDDPSQGIRNYAMIGLGGDTARGDHDGVITINGGGNLDLIAGEGRQAFAQIGSGGYDSDRQTSDNLRGGDMGQTTTINIDIDGRLTMLGGGLQNRDTTGFVARLDTATGEIVHPTDPALELVNNDADRGSYVQIGSGGASTGGNNSAEIDIITGTGAYLEAGNSNRQSGYGMIGSGGTWGRSETLSGNISLVARTGDIVVKAATPVEDSEDDPNSGPANPDNVLTARESFFQIGNGGWDTDAQGGNQNNVAGDGSGYSGNITVIAATGSIELTGGGSDVLNNTRDASGTPNNTGGNGSDQSRGMYVKIGNGGPHNGGDASGDIRVSAGANLTITGGRGGEVNFAQIGNGSNDDSRNISGAIVVEVGNDLIMQRGSSLDAKGDLVRDAYAKIGHGPNSIDGGQGDGTGTREGDITVSVGRNLITLNGVNADGADSGRGPHIGHYQLRDDNVAGSIGTLGNTYIAVSRNDPSPAGLGALITSPGTVFTSADGGFLTELRLYMPTAVQDQISDGTFLNNVDYTRTPAPGTRTGADEQLGTEFTFAPGAFGEPTGTFTPEGPYVGNGFGFYNIYFADVVIVPPGGGAAEPFVPVPQDYLFDDLFNTFQDGNFLLEYDGYEDGQLDSMAMDDGIESGSGSGGWFFERVLDDVVGSRRAPYLEEEVNENLERRQIRFSRKSGRSGLTFYVFDPGTNRYSSYQVFGNPRGDTAAAQ